MNSFHFIGLGGIGMSGLAKVLLEKGFLVSGSDEHSSPLLETLSKQGAKVFIGHKKEQVPKNAVVIHSSAIKEDNPEWQQTNTLGLKKLHRSELLQLLAKDNSSLAVTGTHGKTTTTTLLKHVLETAQADPSFVIGGICLKAGTNAGFGKGEYFVFEADESDGTFLNYHPFGSVVTNIDDDHLDHFGSLENLQRAFGLFMDSVPGDHLFWCYESPPLRAIARKGFSYGFDKKADLQIVNRRSFEFTSLIDIAFKGHYYPDLELALPGKELCLNAAGVFGLSLTLGVKEEALREAFRKFAGVKRRREVKLQSEEWLILDDYGHHPTEISVTLKAIKEAIGSRRLVVLFQPHRYSRTKLCFEGFKTAFSSADLVVLTDLYAAGEKPVEGISSQKLAESIKADFFPKEKMVKEALSFLKSGDVIVTMGAGDITHLSDELANKLKR